MNFRGRMDFLRYGLIVIVIGIVLDLFGYTSTLSSGMRGDLYIANTLNLIGTGLILMGLVLFMIYRLRSE